MERLMGWIVSLLLLGRQRIRIYGIFGTQILPFYDPARIATLAQF
jgi:hypothetical protein